MPNVSMSMEEYLALVDAARSTPPMVQSISSHNVESAEVATKKKRKVSAYSRRYGREYKRLRRKFTLKSGSLKKGYSHKRLVKMAHAAAKKVKK